MVLPLKKHINEAVGEQLFVGIMTSQRMQSVEMRIGQFLLILFNREKANQICRLINFHMDAQSRDWKRTNKPESDPVVKNKSASLFVNAFQVLNQVLIITTGDDEVAHGRERSCLRGTFMTIQSVHDLTLA